MVDSIDDTQPILEQPDKSQEKAASEPTKPAVRRLRKSGEAADSSGNKPSPSKFSLWMRLFLLVSLALLIIGGLSGSLGWSQGRQNFGATATIETALYLYEQYNLAMADIEGGQYEIARQRLEFIFVEDAEFLDVSEKWIEVMLVLGQTSVPTDSVLPSPTPTATEDPRPKEELLVVARQHIETRAWTNAIETLLALRKSDESYMSAEVDGMLYLALRNRAVQNILEFGLFEPGLYDFALMEEFGPLDGQALNYQQWARFYLYGNAFWLAYPQEAAYYYGQLVGMAPDLRDSDGFSAFYRYWQSLIHYGDELVEAGDWCLTSDAYQNALAAGNNANLQATADYALELCIALTPSETPTFTATVIPSSTIAGPSATSLASESPTSTTTVTVTETSVGGSTATFTATFTATPIGASSTPTSTLTATLTPTDVPVPSDTPTEIPSATPTETPSP
jgi:hypothetical protein